MGLISAFKKTSGIQKLRLVLWIRGIGLVSALGMTLIRLLVCFTDFITRPSFCHNLNPITTKEKANNIIGHSSFVYVVGNALHWVYLWNAIKLNSRLHWRGYMFTRVVLDIWGMVIWITLSATDIHENQNSVTFYLHLLVTPATIAVLGVAEICIIIHCYKKLDAPFILKLRNIGRACSKIEDISPELRAVYSDFKQPSRSGHTKTDSSRRRFPEKFLISPLDITIDESKVLGGGQYGKVLQGALRVDGKKLSVAVKILHHLEEEDECTNFEISLNEIKVFVHAGDHPNIVKFYGVSSDASHPTFLYVVLEICGLGSLHLYLVKNVSSFTNWVVDSNSYVNVENKTYSAMNTSDLIKFSCQIATGMEYLASKHIIHGDLAARNVLLTDRRVVKITDFGLSRKLYNYATYIKTNKGMALPWKWMSLETLEDFKFSEKSDVWSFGVLLWEIFSLGEMPYPGVKWSLEFAKNLRDGLRLSKPVFSPNIVYETMKSCWEPHDSDRPSFTHLNIFFTEQAKKTKKEFIE